MTKKQQSLLFATVVAAAFFLRLYLALSTTYLWDEDREWILLGRSISLSPASPVLPWRSRTHPALTAYVVKATSSVVGNTPLGYRLGFGIAGTVAVWAVGMLAWEWLGFGAAIAAATGMAFNEYHLGVSALATEKSPYLMCSALAVLNFGRFLSQEKPRDLYVAAVCAGLSALFKESAVLLLPVFIVAFLASGKGAWLKRRESWLAAGLGLLVILPDLVWNLFHWDRGYALHLGRVSGVGFNPHYLLFFGRDLVRDVLRFFGHTLFDPVEEYPAMNAVWGAVLLLCSATALWNWRRLEHAGRLAVLLFWMIVLFFLVCRPATSGSDLPVDAQAWYWVDEALLAGSLLVAWCVVSLTSRWKRALLGAMVVASALSTFNLFGRHLGIPNVATACSPNGAWPNDGRLVPVTVVVQTCQLCDIQVRLKQAAVDRDDGEGLVQASADEVPDADVGTDDRNFRIRASTGASGWKTFSFLYGVTVGGWPERVMHPSITVTKGPVPRLPFWAHQ